MVEWRIKRRGPMAQGLVCTYTNLYIRIHIQTRIHHIHIYTYITMYTPKYIYACVNTRWTSCGFSATYPRQRASYIHIHAYIYMYTYTHIYHKYIHTGMNINTHKYPYAGVYIGRASGEFSAEGSRHRASYIHIHIYIYILIHISTYIQVCTPIYIYTYTTNVY